MTRRGLRLPAAVAAVALTALAIALAAAAALALATASPAMANPRQIAGIVADLPSAHAAAGAARATPARDLPRHRPRALAPRADNLSYGGGPVLHSNRTHVIFWEPAGSGLSFEPGYEALVGRFLTQVAQDSHMTTNVYGLSGQYRDAFGPAAYSSSFGGAVVDTTPLPPNGCTEPSTGPPWSDCVTDAQLESELQQVVGANRLPRGPTDVYFIVTPNGLGDCIDSGSSSCALGGSGSGYCGYHSQTLNGLLYAVIPYNAVAGHCQSDNPRPNFSTADPTVSTISHEHSEVVTDPEEDAWITGTGEENGDLCIQNFGPALGGSGQAAWNEVIHGGHYFLQEEWSNADGGCQPRAKPDRVSFGTTGKLEAARRVPFRASARAGHGAIVAYNWFFGDGAGGHGRTPGHAYRRPGVYRVVLRTTDSAANWTFYARTLRVGKAPAKRTHSRRR